jgi:hypothetical protein
LTLTINGEKVDFRLEKERFLREALQGVEDWLSGTGLVVIGVRCNGRTISEDGLGAEGDTPLEGVEELALEVRHARELRVAALQEKLSETMERERTAGAGEREEAVRRREEASRRFREAVETYTALQDLARELADMEGKLGEVSVLLQSGKDRLAMETVTRFTDIIEGVLAILPKTSNGSEAAKLFADINPRLREILAAFDAKDFILVGDILEYEIAPRLGGLAALLARSV